MCAASVRRQKLITYPKCAWTRSDLSGDNGDFPRNIALSEFGFFVSKESETVLCVSGAITQINCPCDLQNSGSEIDPVIGPVSDLYI